MQIVREPLKRPTPPCVAIHFVSSLSTAMARTQLFGKPEFVVVYHDHVVPLKLARPLRGPTHFVPALSTAILSTVSHGSVEAPQAYVVHFDIELSDAAISVLREPRA